MKTLRISLLFIIGVIFSINSYAQELKTKKKAKVKIEVIDDNGNKKVVDTTFTIDYDCDYIEILRQIKEQAGFSDEEIAKMKSELKEYAKQMTIDMDVIMDEYFDNENVQKHMMAVSEDQATSQSLGIGVARLVGISWAIACSLGAFSGILITNISGIHYSMVEIGIKAIAVAIIGGFESFGGLLAAGILIGLIESFGVAFIDPLFIGGSVREIIVYIIMILVLLVKPYGLFGWVKIERV